MFERADQFVCFCLLNRQNTLRIYAEATTTTLDFKVNFDHTHTHTLKRTLGIIAH